MRRIMMPLEKMKGIFNEEALLQRWLDVETALARAEASLGIIPEEAAREISAKAKAELIDEDYRQQDFRRTGHILVSTINAFQRICDGNAGEYIHWGATTQDIIDTAGQMATKAAHRVIFDALREIEADLLELVAREADTLMAGRTHGQHALPLTWGYKIAVWVREIRRHIERLKESRKRLFVGQLAGAVGTYTSWGEKGPEVEAMMMRELGLSAPDICWHASRDRGAEFACLVAMVAGTMGKIAREVYHLQSTEVGEVEEPFHEGEVGSSTMPHKRNPFDCENSVALSRRIRYYAPLAIEGMAVEHERGDAGWYIQRDSLGEMCLLMGNLLSRMKEVCEGLITNRAVMKENLDKLRGLILSEAVMLELGHSLGRQTGHEVVYGASMKAYEEGITLKEALLREPRITQYLSEKQIDEMLDPARYTGLSAKIARQVVALTRKERENDLTA
jgi:adenylosuccinate lyase